jgi:colicin import membrane protein
MTKLRLALAISLGMHFVVIGALLLNGFFSVPKTAPELFNPGPIIEAKVIDENALQQQRQKVKDQEKAIRDKELQRIKDLERRAEDAKKKQQQEAKLKEQIKQQKQKNNE